MTAQFDGARREPALERYILGYLRAPLPAVCELPSAATHRQRLRAGIESTFAKRLSPERTRRATWFERLTVGRLSWDAITRLNRWLELLGRIATVVWAGLIASIVLGVDVKDLVQEAVNSGQPLQDVVIIAVIVPTLAFFVLHSVIGFLRWRLQRELWRRDVARLEGGPALRPDR